MADDVQIANAAGVVLRARGPLSRQQLKDAILENLGVTGDAARAQISAWIRRHIDDKNLVLIVDGPNAGKLTRGADLP